MRRFAAIGKKIGLTGRDLFGGWLVLCVAVLAGFILVSGAAGQTQTGPAKPSATVPALAQLGSAKDELSRLTAEYKKSLERLTIAYREELARAEAQRARTEQLVERGLVTPRELQARAAEVAAWQTKLDEAVREQTSADEQMADMLAEAGAIEQLARKPPPAVVNGSGRVIVGSSFIRFTGLGSWTLAGAPAVRNFFQQRFGRPLPVSAFGQSRLHDMWRWDHRNAMDVGLNPASVEGQALIAYLRANGIPFGAFRQAIPGVATGPHIHVGMPSHRLAN